jgi:hypothetical protein
MTKARTKSKARRRYTIGMMVPKSIGVGRKLMHNSITHTIDTPCGVNGFRSWTDVRPPSSFKRCRCGWSGLPHFSGQPNYRCEPGSWEALEEKVGQELAERFRAEEDGRS